MLEDVAAAYLIIAPLAASAALLGIGIWVATRRAAMAHARAKVRRTRLGRRQVD